MATTHRLAAALALAATAVVLGQGTAYADPEPAPAPAPEQPAPAPAPAPGGNVVYTVTADGPGQVELFYLVNQPPSKAAYNADAYSFVQRVPVALAPGVPWTFSANLADPQWAILTVSSTTHGGQAAPNVSCDIAVDGHSVAHDQQPYNPRCQLSNW